METKLGHGKLAVILVLAPVWAGCGKGSDVAVTETPPHPGKSTEAKASDSIPTPENTPPAARASDRPANEKGQVFIVEYHHIKTGRGDMFRTTDEFRKDLERLYKDGFRPCTVSQYLGGKMGLPPGASPAVFTFDDANPSQLQFKADGTVAPDCAVGIWQEFAKTHPDFPVRATFYVLPDVMWGQPKWVKQKIELLRHLGCELGNHTMTHPILKRLSDEAVKKEIGTANDRLEKFGEPMPPSFAYPFGVAPKNKSIMHGFDYQGKHYTLKAALLVGANPAPSPKDPKLDVLRIPRIQAYNGPYGLNEWLDKFEKGKVKVYVAP